ncbi:MAG: helix-turn-helix domain-containing protein [Chlamydiia bacterium]|nr:helix-turn-helix domain-containing protein [Chlamydiia bacterium]
MSDFEVTDTEEVTAKFYNQGTFSNPFIDSRSDMSYRTEIADRLRDLNPKNQIVDVSYDAVLVFSGGKISKVLLKNFQFMKKAGYLDLNVLSSFSDQGFSKENKYAKIIEQLSHQIYGDLTPKEMECIALSMIGLSAKQIGKYIGNTHRTIETYLFHAFSKIGVCSKKESIESAIESRTLHLWQTIANYLLYEKYRV